MLCVHTSPYQTNGLWSVSSQQDCSCLGRPNRNGHGESFIRQGPCHLLSPFHHSDGICAEELFQSKILQFPKVVQTIEIYVKETKPSGILVYERVAGTGDIQAFWHLKASSNPLDKARLATSQPSIETDDRAPCETLTQKDSQSNGFFGR